MTITLERRADRAPLPTPAAPCEIAVRGLSVRYPGRPDVLTAVSFRIARGEAVALVGANGAGKSTLLRSLLGLIRPAAGDVELFGRPLPGLGPGELRRLRASIGFVAQQHNLVARLSVLSNVVQGCLATRPGPRHWLQALAPRRSRERALSALDAVGLAGLAGRRADTLSGGQSQRVAIARALVGGPRLILADEPAASLDPAAGEEVMRNFAEVARATGTTLVFTSHNLDHAAAYAGRILGLRHGRLALDARAGALPPGGLLDLYG